jgi:glycosyltransferase involved in cell wall biosynthesis
MELPKLPNGTKNGQDVTKSKLFSQTWLVIPGLNEAKYLGRVLQKALKQIPRIVYVDDGSSDQSVKIAKKYLKHVLVHEVNLGKGAAMKTGCEYVFKHLKGQAVILMDADDQHKPEEIQLFRQRLESGAQIVLGARSLFSEMPLIRKLGNAIVSGLILVLFWRYIPDVLSGYKAFTRAAYRQLRWSATDYSVELEIAAKIAQHRLQFSPVSIKTIYHDLDRGMNIIDGVKVLVKIIGLRFGL